MGTRWETREDGHGTRPTLGRSRAAAGQRRRLDEQTRRRADEKTKRDINSDGTMGRRTEGQAGGWRIGRQTVRGETSKEADHIEGGSRTGDRTRSPIINGEGTIKSFR